MSQWPWVMSQWPDPNRRTDPNQFYDKLELNRSIQVPELE